MRVVLQNANFRRLLLAAVLLRLGDALMRMGLIEFFRVNEYDVKLETAKLLFWLALPGLVLGPVAIAYVDRWQRRSVLMISDAARAVMVVVIAVWLMPVVTGRLEWRGLGAVYAMIFLSGAVATFYLPARTALLPNLLTNSELIQANTLLTATVAVANMGGSGLGGFVAERMGVEWAVLANALAYVASVGLVWAIRVEPGRAQQGAPTSSLAELRAGLVYLWEHPTALPLVILTGVFAFVGGVFIVAFTGFAVTEPPDGLGLGTGGAGYLLVAFGVGSGVGLALMGRAKEWTRAAWLPFGQLVILGGLLLALSSMSNPWLAAAALFGLGMVGAPLMIPIDARLQEHVEEQRRGAVFATRGMLTSATMVVAFWLQFGTNFFRETPAPTILWWLGIGTIVSGGLTFWALHTRRSTN